MQARTHIVEATEIQELDQNGVVIDATGGDAPSLLNQHFPNIEIRDFYESIDTLLSPLAGKSIPVYRIIMINGQPKLEIELYSKDYSDKVAGLAFSRIFFKDQADLIVDHHFFRIPEIHRGKGIAKKVIKLCLQQYINMGVKRIELHAALTDGGYAWTKYHFTIPDKKEVDLILTTARLSLSNEDFAVVKRFYDNYYQKQPDGKAFPIVKWGEFEPMKDVLRGSSWHGEIDFNNQEQITNFIEYVSN